VTALPAARGTRLAVRHEPVRRVILATLSPEARRARHATLLDALGADGAPPEILAQHAFGADRRELASRLADEAALSAEAKLAFSAAAALLGQALAWHPGDAARAHALRVRRARALYHAGRCAEAAPEFEAAARDATATARWELERMAVDSYLAAGHIAPGLAAATALSDRIGPGLVKGQSGAMRRTLWRLLRLALRGTHLGRQSFLNRTRGEDAVALSRARVDLSWSLGKGLIYVQPMRGAEAVITSLHEALALGDPHRAGRALAFAGTGILWHLPGQRGRARRYLEQAEALARTGHDLYLEAMSLVWRGFAAAYAAEWPTATRLAEEGLARLRDAGPGVSWERVVASALVAWSLQWRGEMGLGARHARAALREASDAGDLYGQVTFRQMLLASNLAAGELDAGRDHLAWIGAHWQPGGYSIPEFYVAWFGSLIDLYEDRVDVASERFAATLPAFAKSGGYRSPPSRIDAWLHEARLLLLRPSLDVRGATACRRLAARLDKAGRPDGPAHAAVVRAALATRSGIPEVARRELDRAIPVYDRLGLGAYAAISRHARATLTGEAAEAAAQHAWLAAREVTDPARFGRVMLPIVGRAG